MLWNAPGILTAAFVQLIVRPWPLHKCSTPIAIQIYQLTTERRVYSLCPKKHSRTSQPLKRGRNRQLRIRGQLRSDPPDLGRIARTVVAIAVAQAEKEAQEQVERRAERQETDHE